MEQKFGKNSIDIKVLREFCEREGKMVEYRKGEQSQRGASSTSREASATSAIISHGSRLRANSWLIILASCQANLPRLPSKP